MEIGLTALQVGKYFAGVVARAVIGDDDLEISRKSTEHVGHMADGALDNGLFVVRGQHGRDTRRSALRRGHHESLAFG